MPVARAIRACVPCGFVRRSSCFKVRFVTMRQCCFIYIQRSRKIDIGMKNF